jgi:hypothetical protein
MSHLIPIYDVWGGNAEAMAADIGELGVTVRQWRNRGDIPSRAWPKIIKAAAAKDVILRLESFLAPEIVSDLPQHSEEADGVSEGVLAPAAAEGAEAPPRPFSPTSSGTSGPEEDIASRPRSSTGPMLVPSDRQEWPVGEAAE